MLTRDLRKVPPTYIQEALLRRSQPVVVVRSIWRVGYHHSVHFGIHRGPLEQTKRVVKTDIWRQCSPALSRSAASEVAVPYDGYRRTDTAPSQPTGLLQDRLLPASRRRREVFPRHCDASSAGTWKRKVARMMRLN